MLSPPRVPPVQEEDAKLDDEIEHLDELEVDDDEEENWDRNLLHRDVFLESIFC